MIEIEGDMTGQFPEEYASVFPDSVRLVCAPMAAAGRAMGVSSPRPLTEPPLDGAERHLLWTLGKTAALASVARLVAKHAEEAAQLEQRIDLAREIHESVIQRLFGISMALDGEGDLAAAARRRCATETQEALRTCALRSSVRSAVPRGRRRPRSSQRSSGSRECTRTWA